MPPVPPGSKEGAQVSKIYCVPPEYLNIHAPIPTAQLFTVDAFLKNIKFSNHFILDLLNDETTSTGLSSICSVEKQLWYILRTRAAYSVSLDVQRRSHQKEVDS
jgi:hypothetical protein